MNPPGSVAEETQIHWGRGLRNLSITLVLLAVMAVTAVVFLRRDEPVPLKVRGQPIENGGLVLDQAEAAFRAVLDADGATYSPDARCYFAPAAKAPAASGPDVACGAILLGISGVDRPWLLGTVSYRTGSGERAIGRFDRFRSAEKIDASRLRRPDGKRPPKSPKLIPSTAGLRDDEGRRLLGLEETLTTADADFLRRATDAKAAVRADSRCYFGYTEGRSGLRISDQKLWCGPILLVESTPDQLWVSHSMRASQQDDLVTARVQRVSMTDIRSTTPLKPGVLLFRPDDRKPTDEGGLRPPDPAPQSTGVLKVLTQNPEGVSFTPPLDGRLVTPSISITLEGLARAGKLGAGRDALVAPPGETFVVAQLSRRRQAGSVSDSTAAAIVVDGNRRPFSGWSSLPERAVVVVGAATGAKSVDLEVSFAGRAQTISLLTGQRGPGAPVALYRQVGTTGIAQGVDITVPLPAGPPVRVRGNVAEARIEAWRSKDGWAPSGEAFVSISVTDWHVTSPCCDLKDVKVSAAWRLVLPNGTIAKVVAQSATSGPPPALWLVNETFLEGRAELVVTVSYVDGKPGEVVSPSVVVPVRFPA